MFGTIQLVCTPNKIQIINRGHSLLYLADESRVVNEKSTGNRNERSGAEKCHFSQKNPFRSRDKNAFSFRRSRRNAVDDFILFCLTKQNKEENRRKREVGKRGKGREEKYRFIENNSI